MVGEGGSVQKDYCPHLGGVAEGKTRVEETRGDPWVVVNRRAIRLGRLWVKNKSGCGLLWLRYTK